MLRTAGCAVFPNIHPKICLQNTVKENEVVACRIPRSCTQWDGYRKHYSIDVDISTGEWRESNRERKRESRRNAALIGKVDFRFWPGVTINCWWLGGHYRGCLPGKWGGCTNRGDHNEAPRNLERARLMWFVFKQRQVTVKKKSKQPR